MNCQRARLGFPDLMAGGPADAAASEHLKSCAACVEELRSFRTILDAASRCAGTEVPDPGEAYWERFLPSVRARVALRQTTAARSRSSLRAVAAAAVLMLAASAGALLVPSRPVFRGDQLVAADQRLDEAFETMPGLLPEVAADMLGTDPIPEITPRQVLEAIEEIDRSPGLAVDWSNDEVERMLDQLTAEQVARLKADLAAELG